ncbi:MAG: hypothetical protein KDA41_06095, partial [Planctomycetales bacterium]|nr:hypothetical protein [Planctomycetales bacterium]
RTRWVDTAAEMKAGQTLALAGLVQQQVEAENRGVPVMADLPWIGAAFRRVEHRINEVELLVLVTPELVGPMNPHQVPTCLPGSFTTNPCDTELYGRGYLEVPNCCDGASLQCGPGCSNCGGGPMTMDPVMTYDQSPQVMVSPHEPQPAVQSAPDGYPAAGQGASVPPRRIPAVSTGARAGGGQAGSVNNVNYRTFQNPDDRPPVPPAANSQPQLIGPLGYDLLN